MLSVERFETEIEAAKARDVAALAHFGHEYRKFNFPLEE